MRKTFLFTSGLQVSYEPITPRTLFLFEAEWTAKRPKPPKEIIEVEGPLKGTEQENPDDPAYQEALAEYESKAEQARSDFFMRRAKFEPLEEGWRERVAEYRKDMQDVGVDVGDADDALLWITDIACLEIGEMEEFLAEVTGAHIPSAERRAAIRDSFRTNLQES